MAIEQNMHVGASLAVSRFRVLSLSRVERPPPCTTAVEYSERVHAFFFPRLTYIMDPGPAKGVEVRFFTVVRTWPSSYLRS